MPFFTNDPRLTEEWADPGSQATQPLGKVSPGQSPLSSTENLSDPFGLGGLPQLFQNQGGAQQQQSFGATLPSGLLSGTSYGISGTSYDIGGLPPQNVPNAFDTRGITGGGQGGGSDYSPWGTNPNAAQDWLNASSWEKRVAGMFNPLGGAAGLNLAHGINPLPSGVRDFLGMAPTTSWYTESTDFFGNPLSDAQLGGSSGFGDDYGSYGSQYEADVADMYGFGSDEHFGAIEESFNDSTSGGGFTSGYDGSSDSNDDGGYGDDSDDGGAGWGSDDI